ncbi:MAG TPA: hypothetical protein VN381_11875 [Anaerovoracaceae bacterium]|nr:hypothetical protein [Anaerovoracaceae bacterium]
MFTLLYNALKAIGQLPEVNGRESGSGDTGKPLSAFTDADGITILGERRPDTPDTNGDRRRQRREACPDGDDDKG